MTKISVFGEEQNPSDKTPIEIVLVPDDDGTYVVGIANLRAGDWDNVMLLNNGVAHGKKYDTIVVWNDSGDQQKYTCLGYWNDGVE